MIRKEDAFYTSRLLPWQYTDDLYLSWEIFSFNRTLADLVPHQGLPRFVTQESESHTDNLLRRGLAFIIEHLRVHGSGTMTDQCRKASSGVVTSLSNSYTIDYNSILPRIIIFKRCCAYTNQNIHPWC